MIYLIEVILVAKEKIGIIEDIKNKDNLVLLILNSNYVKNWQHPTKISNYVTKNLTKTGEIDSFEIYEK